VPAGERIIRRKQKRADYLLPAILDRAFKGAL